jgi:hypothetical protein
MKNTLYLIADSYSTRSVIYLESREFNISFASEIVVTSFGFFTTELVLCIHFVLENKVIRNLFIRNL